MSDDRQDLPKLYKEADSRLTGYFGKVTHSTLPLERTYCFLCGAPAGWTSNGLGPHIAPQHIVVTCNKCDQKISEHKNAFPLQEVPRDIAEAFGFVPED